MSKDENKDNNLSEIIHSVLISIIYAPALILLLIYLFAMNLKIIIYR